MKEFSNEDPELAWFIGLVEGEGSFYVSVDRRSPQLRFFGGFKLAMTDKDVVERARMYLQQLDIYLNMKSPTPSLKRNNEPSGKTLWAFQTRRVAYLKIIIDQCYPYFSEKKQSDCDRVLKNLVDRGLL